MRTSLAAAVAAAVALLAAGCGGGSSAKSTALASLRTPPTGAYANFADGVESACLERNNELRDLSRPQTRAQFDGYIASLLNIAHYYRSQLAALHPAYRAGDRRTFAYYVRLIDADEKASLGLLAAVHRSDRRAVARLVAAQRRRSSLEQTLLSRLGVSCD